MRDVSKLTRSDLARIVGNNIRDIQWLEAIQDNLGADARTRAAQQGRIVVEARWPKRGVPMPAIGGNR